MPNRAEYGQFVTGFPYDLSFIYMFAWLSFMMLMFAGAIVLFLPEWGTTGVLAAIGLGGFGVGIAGTSAVLYITAQQGNAVDVFENGLLIRRGHQVRFLRWDEFSVKQKRGQGSEVSLHLQFARDTGMTLQFIQDAGYLASLISKYQAENEPE